MHHHFVEHPKCILRVSNMESIQNLNSQSQHAAERLHDGVQLPETLKPKFMVPRNLSLRKFVEILRGKLPWEEMALATTQIRLTVRNGTAMPQHEKVGDLYDAEKDPEDGFLYITYADRYVFFENSFRAYCDLIRIQIPIHCITTSRCMI